MEGVLTGNPIALMEAVLIWNPITHMWGVHSENPITHMGVVLTGNPITLGFLSNPINHMKSVSLEHSSCETLHYTHYTLTGNPIAHMEGVPLGTLSPT